MSDEFGIFGNLPRRRRRDDDDERSGRVRGLLTMLNFVPEGPMRPRPSGVGGPSVGQGAPTPPPVTSVWSAADAAANGMTLSNGGLTVTPSGAGSFLSIRGSIGKTTGKLYVEVSTSIAVTSPNPAIGAANAAFNPAAYLGLTTAGGSSFGAFFLSGGAVQANVFTSNYSVTSLGSLAAGDVFGIAIDFGAGTVWLAHNNTWANPGNPSTGASPALSFTPATVGALFPGLTFNGANCGVWTLQPTAASQKFTPPAGFSPWG
jgi:hypothetical protein